MPDTLPDIVRSRPCASFGRITTNDFAPLVDSVSARQYGTTCSYLVVLEQPYCLGKETSRDKVQEACGRNQENLN